MGKLRITDQGLKLYGEAEFVKDLRANMIRPRQVKYFCVNEPRSHCIGVTDIFLILTLHFQNSELTLQSTANVTVNARNSDGNITGQLFIGNDEVVARNQKFSIKTDQGKNILYADKDKIFFAADKLEFSSKSEETTELFLV